MVIAVEFEVRDNSIRIKLDSSNSAYVAFHTEGNKIFLDSTFTPEKFRGKDVGSELMKAAMQHAKEKGLSIVPVCSFAIEYFKKHPEYGYVLQKG